MVEGESEILSVPKLVYKMQVPSLYLTNTYRVHGVSNLISCQQGKWKLVDKGDGEKWHKYLRNVQKASYVLLLLDGDGPADSGKRFCVREAAHALADSAKKVGAGKTFSLAVAFVRQEFESWLLAGCESLCSKLTDGEIAALEEAPRDAKGRIREITQAGYNEVRDQPEFVKQLNIGLLSTRMRSFRRFEKALRQLDDAARNGVHICTPA